MRVCGCVCVCVCVYTLHRDGNFTGRRYISCNGSLRKDNISKYTSWEILQFNTSGVDQLTYANDRCL